MKRGKDNEESGEDQRNNTKIIQRKIRQKSEKRQKKKEKESVVAYGPLNGLSMES